MQPTAVDGSRERRVRPWTRHPRAPGGAGPRRRARRLLAPQNLKGITAVPGIKVGPSHAGRAPHRLHGGARGRRRRRRRRVAARRRARHAGDRSAGLREHGGQGERHRPRGRQRLRPGGRRRRDALSGRAQDRLERRRGGRRADRAGGDPDRPGLRRRSKGAAHGRLRLPCGDGGRRRRRGRRQRRRRRRRHGRQDGQRASGR